MRALVWTTLATLTLVGCERTRPEAVEVKKEAKEAVDATGRYVGEQKEAFAAGMQQRIDALNARMAKLRVQAEQGSDAAEADAKAQLSKLEAQKERAQQRLAELKQGGSGAWEKLKGGVEAAVEELEGGFDRATE